jgi:hypothetical protein
MKLKYPICHGSEKNLISQEKLIHNIYVEEGEKEEAIENSANAHVTIEHNIMEKGEFDSISFQLCQRIMFLAIAIEHRFLIKWPQATGATDA